MPIRRAVLERINGPFLAQRARDEDERYGRPFDARDFQRRHPIEGRQRIVRKDKVNAALFERRHKLSAALHAVDGTRDALGFQGGLHEHGIVWVIFQVQDAERGFHW
jgi:hypothetical protein